MSILQNRPHIFSASFTIKYRIKRLIWCCIYYLCFRFTPIPFHGWRIMILRLCGAKIGQNCHIYPSAKIWAPWNLRMDNEACIASEVNCYCQGKISLGKQVIISQGSFLCTGTHDYLHPQFQLKISPITIENKVWVGAQAFIGPGVHLAEGCIIGARAVIFKNTEAWKIYIGNPAICIKSRVIHEPYLN